MKHHWKKEHTHYNCDTDIQHKRGTLLFVDAFLRLHLSNNSSSFLSVWSSWEKSSRWSVLTINPRCFLELLTEVDWSRVSKIRFDLAPHFGQRLSSLKPLSSQSYHRPSVIRYDWVCFAHVVVDGLESDEVSCASALRDVSARRDFLFNLANDLLAFFYFALSWRWATFRFIFRWFCI